MSKLITDARLKQIKDTTTTEQFEAFTYILKAGSASVKDICAVVKSYESLIEAAKSVKELFDRNILGRDVGSGKYIINYNSKIKDSSSNDSDYLEENNTKKQQAVFVRKENNKNKIKNTEEDDNVTDVESSKVSKSKKHDAFDSKQNNEAMANVASVLYPGLVVNQLPPVKAPEVKKEKPKVQEKPIEKVIEKKSISKIPKVIYSRPTSLLRNVIKVINDYFSDKNNIIHGKNSAWVNINTNNTQIHYLMLGKILTGLKSYIGIDYDMKSGMIYVSSDTVYETEFNDCALDYATVLLPPVSSLMENGDALGTLLPSGIICRIAILLCLTEKWLSITDISDLLKITPQAARVSLDKLLDMGYIKDSTEHMFKRGCKYYRHTTTDMCGYRWSGMYYYPTSITAVSPDDLIKATRLTEWQKYLLENMDSKFIIIQKTINQRADISDELSLSKSELQAELVLARRRVRQLISLIDKCKKSRS